MLGRWAIDEELVAVAPVSPYFFDPRVFIQLADDALARTEDTPPERVAREALPPDGTLLDVACGAGAASLRLRPTRAVGVDSSSPLLSAFVERAQRMGINASTIEGSWPDVAPQTPIADVVVCHHVFYNVPDLAPFVAALSDHARRRVVVELTAVHPMAWMAPYWEAMHGVTQPDRPVAEDAVAVLRELGLTVRQERWRRSYQMIGETGDQALQRIARRLCLPSARHDELRQLLLRKPPPEEREVVMVSWSP
jgi:SAM-dependent methyltransferase